VATTNIERVGRAMELLKEGLRPFVEREFRAKYGDNWRVQAAGALRQDHEALAAAGDAHLDAQALLALMWNMWNEVFRDVLGHAERSLVSELRDVRNRWAHQEPFSSDDAYRALDSAARLLTAVSADEAREVERSKQELLRVRFDEQARTERRKVAENPVEGRPAAGLRPWREVITPHPDVASGRYQQAEFAADLSQVHRGEGADEYREPKEFYQRTYLTEGLRHLLSNALRRLSGQGGDPVVELQTNFGGGKTHSMLALYHLFSGGASAELLGVEPVLREVGVPRAPLARRAVLVGTALSPGQTHTKQDGTKIHTLWGELAYQLGGPTGYSLVAEADRQGVSPGSDALRQLFEGSAPCLILIDEWVAFVRQLYGVEGLPAGSFDANLTFAQALTEAARQAPQTLVVASIPSSDIEIGGQGGHEALTRIRNTFGRMESAWRPASAEEGFEIVRRRLFQPITDPHHFAARDAVVHAFGQLYATEGGEFPTDCREAGYRRRIEGAYPIHPELFDRLYNDWSSLDKFQRTRGVLRLMAAVIHELWERQDGSLLIMPASVPVDADSVRFELTRYMDDPWLPVIEKDVDGPASVPLALDRDNPNLGRFSASRRVARTLYLGSAPTLHTARRGLDDRSIKLGCVQPGESVATFGDALRRLSDAATHLYVDGRRYWFSTQPSVTRLASDRAAQLDIHDVWAELIRRLRADGERGDFARVHAVPATSGDVPDDTEARLVVLGPEYPHSLRTADSPARQWARETLDRRGAGPRIHRNMVVFLAPDRTRLAELETGLRQYLAWTSIDAEKDALNLDGFQRNQAATKAQDADSTVRARILETYIWALAPVQPDLQGPLEWTEVRLQGPERLAVRASRKLRSEELLITAYSGSSLRHELDRALWRGDDHVGVQALWGYITSYPYLPRLRDERALLDAIRDGVSSTTWSETFAYASRHDAATGRYEGLVYAAQPHVVFDSHSVLVKPEIAQRQIDADAENARAAAPPRGPYEGDGPEPGQAGHEQAAAYSQRGDVAVVPPPARPSARHFHGAVELDPMRMGRDAGTIATEVVAHLSALVKAGVRVRLEIEADLPDGAPEAVVRTVSENCRTLRFTTHAFEDE